MSMNRISDALEDAWGKALPKIQDHMRISLDSLKAMGGQAAGLGAEIAKAMAETVRLTTAGELAAADASIELARYFDALGELERGTVEGATREGIAAAKEGLKIAAEIGIVVARAAAGV